MARKDALLRLHQRLMAQRADLRKKLAIESETAADFGAGTSDLADVANDDTEREMASQLASLETRELLKIDRAIRAIREGRYGLCELCEKPIPVARLQALPYSSCCVDCQRRQESRRQEEGYDADWEMAHSFQVRQVDPELTLSDIAIED